MSGKAKKPANPAGNAPRRGMRRSAASRKLNVAGYGNTVKRPGKGPGNSRGSGR